MPPERKTSKMSTTDDKNESLTSSAGSAVSTRVSPTAGLPLNRRQSHFDNLIQKAKAGQRNQQQQQPPRTSPRASGGGPTVSKIEEGNEEDDDDDEEQKQEEGREEAKLTTTSIVSTPSDVNSGARQASDGLPSPFSSSIRNEKPHRRRSKMEKQESTFFDIGNRLDDYQQCVGDDRLVQVNLRQFTYQVPVKWDRPSIKTVFNQSVCYMTYEVFRRLHLYCQRNNNKADEEEATKKETATYGDNEEGKEEDEVDEWGNKSAIDVYLPYQKKAILKDITLALEPGKTYLLLSPPGGGKTTLLKAIAGLIPHAVGIDGKPMKNKPNKSGRIEYNGVTQEVRLCLQSVQHSTCLPKSEHVA